MPGTALDHVVAEFLDPAQRFTLEPLGAGNINDTYLLAAGKQKFLLQRINTAVFQDPAAVQENYRLIYQHLRKQELGLQLPELLPTRSGDSFFQDGENTWRLVRFLENTVAIEQVDRPEQIAAACHAIGLFLKSLNAGEAPALHTTIPDFHNYPLRLRQLEKAFTADRVGRAAKAERVYAYLLAEQGIFAKFSGGELPRRLVHNDPKIGNVLFSPDGAAVAVIDWDTVMPGFLLNDFGDMVRTMASTAGENEADLSKVSLHPEFLAVICRSFLLSLSSWLTEAERDSFWLGPQYIVLEQTMRFLADYLRGDTYYKITYPDHNWVRTQNQLQLYRSIVQQQDTLRRLVDQYLG